jgi:hypothetical protein
MANQAQMDRLLGKALFDADFRHLLLTDPEAAARQLRYKLSDEQVYHIQRLDDEKMDDLARRFAEDADWHPKTNLTFW